MPESNLIEIGGLWEQTAKSGREYLGGKADDKGDTVIPAGSRLFVFANDGATHERAPAFRLLYAPPDGDPHSKPPPQKGAFAKFAGKPAAAAGPAPKSEPGDDDIPF